jgi:hypothetical protein
MCIPTDAAGITLGVDTHKDFHVALALDGLGERLGTLSIPTTPAGYEKLLDRANGFGPLEGVAIEGTGSFGAGLTRFLQAEGAKVLEEKREGNTQLIVRTRVSWGPHLYWTLTMPFVLVGGEFFTTRKMLHGIKRRVELTTSRTIA